MPFLSGSLGFERFTVSEFAAQAFNDEHIEVLKRYSSDQLPSLASQEAHVGFVGGAHLFDHAFDIDKNVIAESLHCSVRIDTNSIPSAIKKAWLQMELAALAAENSTGRPNKKQRQEAKESVQQRCDDEAASGKYRRMQHYPILWDLRNSQLFLAGSGNAVMGNVADLVERAFEIQLHRESAGSIAQDWAKNAGLLSDLLDIQPASFVPSTSYSDVAWANEHSDKPDYLGNEFLMWLWWHGENVGDTITTASEQEITYMFAKTLTLECPIGEHGKETISSESPVQLAEAMQAVQTGKLPRKAGLTLVSGGEQFDLVLQAESFAVSGAKIHIDDTDDGYGVDDRIESVRSLCGTVDGLFCEFLRRRVGEAWHGELEQIRGWLSGHQRLDRVSAA